MEAPLSVTVSMAPSPAKPKRSLDLRDMMDELPMLASLKDQKWMARLPRNMFPALKKSPRHNAGDSSPTSGSETDTTLLSPGFLPTPRVCCNNCCLVLNIALKTLADIIIFFLLTDGEGYVGAGSVDGRGGSGRAGPSLLHGKLDPVAHMLVSGEMCVGL